MEEGAQSAEVIPVVLPVASFVMRRWRVFGWYLSFDYYLEFRVIK